MSAEPITQNLNERAFIFTLESTGNLPPERIVTEAAKVLLEKLDELSGKIERGETYESIEEFEVAEEVSRRLYSVGTGDFEVEDEE